MILSSRKANELEQVGSETRNIIVRRSCRWPNACHVQKDYRKTANIFNLSFPISNCWELDNHTCACLSLGYYVLKNCCDYNQTSATHHPCTLSRWKPQNAFLLNHRPKYFQPPSSTVSSVLLPCQILYQNSQFSVFSTPMTCPLLLEFCRCLWSCMSYEKIANMVCGTCSWYS